MSAIKFDKLIALIEKSKDILLIIHLDPDGDTIASSLALAAALERKGKNAAIVGRDPAPDVFTFLPGIKRIKQDYLAGDFDAVLVLDCGDLKRTGFPKRLLEFARRKKTLVNIDHHRKSDLHKAANLTIFDEQAAATAEIVYELIAALGGKITSSIATLLLCGLYTDTGGFRHANTTAKTLELASRLLERGGRLNQIKKHLDNHKSMAALKLWGVALSRIKSIENLGAVVSVVTKQDLDSAGATSQDLAGLVNLVGSAAGNRAAILLAQIDDETIKVSLRTERNDIDMSRLAEVFGGGGHKKAAGFTLRGKLVESKNGWKVELA